MTPTLTVAIILLAAVIAFVSNRIPPGIVALGVPIALYLTGTLSLEQSLAGFGDPIVIYIATLFVVSEALDATGVTTWIGQVIIERTGEKPASAIAGVVLLTAALTALISVNGAVAALVPVGVVVAMKINQAPSRVLLPLAFAGHAGSLLTLMGSPVNLLVSSQTWRTMPADGRSGSSSSLSSAYRLSSGRCSSSSSPALGCCPIAARPRCRATSRSTPPSWPSTTTSTASRSDSTATAARWR